MADRIKVYIGGSIYTEWTNIEIVKDLQAVSGAFSLTLGDLPYLYKFADGEAIRIEIEGTPVIDGYIEGIDFAGEDSKYDLTLTGRDKTADIIDCSAVTESSEFLNISYKALAEKLCSPFGIKVIARTSKANTKISKVSLQQGSVYEELEREARKLGIFLYPDAAGGLVLDEIGSETLSTRLELPGNVISIGGKVDVSDRFSEYRIKGQQSSAGVLTPKQQSQVTAKAIDSNVTRYRPLIIVAESGINSSQAKAKVEWESAVRAGRSEELIPLLDGWTDLSASLWSVNKIVSCKFDDLDFEGEMLIKAVAFRFNETDGQHTQLTLSYADAFAPKPVIDKKTGKKRILPV